MNWRQEENKIIVEYNQREFFFLMPEYFKLQEVHPDLIRLAELVLFYPWEKSLKNYKFSRKKRDRTALCFSGGVDSMAAYCLLPKDTILFFHKRNVTLPTAMRADNPLQVFKENGLDVRIIESSHEEIRTGYGEILGFSTDMAPSAALILLADYWDIGYIATGTMLESTYLHKGNKYRNFSEDRHWNFWFNLFENAGLSLVFATAPCSEYLNSKIVTDNKKLAISCVRGKGSPCGKCYKCFRKLCISNIKDGINYRNNEISHYLTARPLKQGASLIHAMNKYGLDIPELLEYKNISFPWLENYYYPALESVHIKYRNYIKNELDKYSAAYDGEEIKNFDLASMYENKTIDI